jgi:hypothetical protein
MPRYSRDPSTFTRGVGNSGAPPVEGPVNHTQVTTATSLFNNPLMQLQNQIFGVLHNVVAISQHYLLAQNERDNEELITHVARRSMLVEVSGPCGPASNTPRPKRLSIHIGSTGERVRPPVQSFFVPTEPN